MDGTRSADLSKSSADTSEWRELLRKEARALAQLGMSVIPVMGKQPAIPWKKMQSDCLALDILDQYCLKRSTTGISVVCGRRSNVMPLDFDDEVGRQAYKQLRREQLIPKSAPTVRTGSGGKHIWFRYRPGIGIKKWQWEGKKAGELRGEGSYVVCPPSIHPDSGQEYTWLVRPEGPLPDISDELLERIGLVTPTEQHPWQSEGQSVEEARFWVERALRKVEEGDGRNDTGSWLAQQLRDQGLSRDQAARLVIEFQSAVEHRGGHRYTRSEVLASLESAFGTAPRAPAYPEPLRIEEMGAAEVAPMDPDLLPGPFRDFAEDISRRMCVPLEFAAVATLAVASGVLGARVKVQPNDAEPSWTEPLNLWAVMVGSPGTKKTPVLHAAGMPLEAIERRLASENSKALRDHEAELAGLEKGDEQPERPPEKRILVGDATTEKLQEIMSDNPGGVIAVWDELRGLTDTWRKSGRETDRAFHLKSWAGNLSHTTDRIIRRTTRIENCCLALVGTIQPGPLRGLVEAGLGEGADADGLLPRLQLLVRPVIPPWSRANEPEDGDARAHYAQVIEELHSLATNAPWKLTGPGWQIRLTVNGKVHELAEPDVLRFDQAAQERYRAWHDTIENRVRSNELSDAHRALLAKHVGLVARLAAICHLVEGGRGKIPLWQLERAIRWSNLLEEHALAIYESVGEHGPAKLLAEKISETLTGKKKPLSETFTARHIAKKEWGDLKRPQVVHEALGQLIEYGWLIPDSKRKEFRLNPRLKTRYGN
jgi:hypothetical protein